jgi:UDP:flavonoid glycosyltransferase YjiC (YdhE family)
MSPRLYLQPTVPSFEYPRSDLPPQVHFIGPLVPSAPAVALPSWWDELLAAKQRGTPIVLVTQGTMATDPRELIVPALQALANDDVLVVATTGRPFARPDDLGVAAFPANARVSPFVAYHHLMPLLSAMVTNGGYGGVQIALRHGVPLVVAGGSEDKPEIAARVAWSGAGIDVGTGTPSPRALRRAIRRVLGEPTFRARAHAIGAEMSQFDAPVTAADLIERLAAEPPTASARSDR